MPIEYEGDGISLQVLLQTFVCVKVTSCNKYSASELWAGWLRHTWSLLIKAQLFFELFNEAFLSQKISNVKYWL